jgi:lipopolysaccharide transport system permease protein
MANDMSASATTKIPVSEITTFQGPPAAAAAPAVHGAPGEVTHDLVIQPSKGWIGVDWAELWRFRELLYFLVWRDVKVRYKQAVLGFGWAVLEPVLNMLVFTAIFGVAAGLRTQLPEGLPYAVFVFAGLIAWKLFATALSQGGMSLVNSQNLLTKIYFPRLFVPTATVGSALVDMALQFAVFAGILAWYGYVPSWHIVFLPFLIALTVVLGLGAAYLLSALTITFRDFRFLIPVITQVWMYLSFVPIPVPKSIRDSEKWQAILGCNPMYVIVALYRKCVTGHGYEIGLNAKYVPVSIAMAVGPVRPGPVLLPQDRAAVRGHRVRRGSDE